MTEAAWNWFATMSDEEPELEYLIQYTPPVLRSDLDAIQAMLRDEDPFVPGVFLHDPYDVITYLPRQMIWREEYCLLVDRNLVTRWIGALAGREATRQDRAAAAVLVFAQAADFLIEPNLAFYELGSSVDQAQVNEEIQAFYRAENIHPDHWASVALGRSSRLVMSGEASRPQQATHDLRKPLYRWRRNYVLALKIAQLHLDGGRPDELMTRLLEWMYHNFLIGGPAIQLASYYFAPGAPRRRLLKHIQSDDRDRALAGIRNAAWDLTLISEWLRHLQTQTAEASAQRIYILCTLDDAIKRMARSVVTFDEEPRSDYEVLLDVFGSVWGDKIGARLAATLDRYQSTASNPARQLHRDAAGGFIDDLISKGEDAIRNWNRLGRND